MKQTLYNGFLACLILSTLTQCSSTSAPQTEEVAINDGFDTSSLDRRYRPQDDFDSFANGGWKKLNPIPSTEGTWGAFGILDKENSEVKLKGIIDEVSKNKSNKPQSDEQKIADMYRSFMDTMLIEKLGLNPLQNYINEIEQVKQLDQWVALSGKLQIIGVPSVVGIYVDADDKNSAMNAVKMVQGGLSLGEKSYYSGTDERMKSIRNEFVKHVDNLMKLSGKSQTNIGKSLLDFETKLAAIQLSNVELRDPLKTYNKVALKDLQKQSKNIDWVNFAAQQQVITDTVVVQNLQYYQKLNTLLSSVPVDVLKQYTLYKLIISYSTYLPSAFKNERFNFYGVIKSGIKEQKKREIQAIDITESIGEGNILGRLYTKKYFPEESKQKVSEMIENVRAVYGERIDQLAWMSESTKKMAKKKLSTFTYKIGYPDQWDDYSAINITPSTLIANVISNSEWSHKKMVKDIGKPVDKKRWYMSPQTVNAYYNPLNNEIVFPAGILQAPFFNPNADDAINYGGIIAVIGHEFTHGFDDQGAQYDEVGNLRNWWTEADFTNFNNLSKSYISYFNKFEVLPQVFVNGELTIGENIADLGGLTLAYYALVRSMKGKKEPTPIDGFTWQQRFFLSWAQVWHNNIKDEELRNRILTDPHAPARQRINGPLRHLNEFYEAFGLKEGDKMWLPAGERIKIW